MSLLSKIVRTVAEACSGNTNSNSNSGKRPSRKRGSLDRIIRYIPKLVTVALPKIVSGVVNATVGFAFRKMKNFFDFRETDMKRGVKESANTGIKSMFASLLRKLLKHLAGVFLGDPDFVSFDSEDKDYFNSQRKGRRNSSDREIVVVGKGGVIKGEVQSNDYNPNAGFVSDEFQKDFNDEMNESFYQDVEEGSIGVSDEGDEFNSYGHGEPAPGT